MSNVAKAIEATLRAQRERDAHRQVLRERNFLASLGWTGPQLERYHARIDGIHDRLSKLNWKRP